MFDRVCRKFRRRPKYAAGGIVQSCDGNAVMIMLSPGAHYISARETAKMGGAESVRAMREVTR